MFLLTQKEGNVPVSRQYKGHLSSMATIQLGGYPKKMRVSIILQQFCPFRSIWKMCYNNNAAWGLK